MDDRFFNAFLPPSVRIAGRRVSRFTLWHQFLLAAIESPISTGVGRFGIPDLLAAVKVCRSSYGEPPSLRPTLLDIAWRVIYCRLPWLFEIHARRLWKWTDLQSSAPLYWRESSGNAPTIIHKEDKAPAVLGIVCSLIARGGLARAEAWDTPSGEARWLDAMIAKNEGAPINFIEERDLKAEPKPLDTMTEEEALAEFRRALPEPIAMRTFEHWKQQREGGRPC